MAENSKIEWTDATFNPWIGCTAVSPACDHCYAEALSKARLGVAWGKGQPRRRTSVQNWHLPLRWNRKAAKEGRRMRVFCASLADVFDTEVPNKWRDDLFALIATTPHLDWLLLTKRPKVARDYITSFRREGRYVVGDRITSPDHRDGNCFLLLQEGQDWPLPNVWLGTTVEDQKMADLRIPELLSTPAAVRFLSMEPLLGPVDLKHLRQYNPQGKPWVDALTGIVTRGQYLARSPSECSMNVSSQIPGELPRIDWVITGGESGPGARPSHPDWFRSLRDQCAAAGVPFLFKQHGDWVSSAEIGFAGHEHRPAVTMAPYEMMRVGKKAAGRHLDGALHDGYPVVG
ncbi:MAG: phage Gp37/Gp68 family protein [Alphaproteobacteria bacterium]